MTTTDQKTAPKPAPQMPPPAPEGKPFQVGLTTALVNTNAADKTVTLRLKRVIKASPEKIYNAFLDPDALAAWLPPHGMVGRTHELDARVGGKFRMSFYTVNKSWSNTFGGTYIELVPGKRIVHTDHFEAAESGHEAQIHVTITLTPVAEGTLVEVVQAGIPAGQAASGAPYGWSQSFEKLAQLVEPELPF